MKTVQATLKDLKLPIVDKLLISSLTLLYMHLRLTEIVNDNEYFGRLSSFFFPATSFNYHQSKVIFVFISEGVEG